MSPDVCDVSVPYLAICRHDVREACGGVPWCRSQRFPVVLPAVHLVHVSEVPRAREERTCVAYRGVRG